MPANDPNTVPLPIEQEKELASPVESQAKSVEDVKIVQDVKGESKDGNEDSKPADSNSTSSGISEVVTSSHVDSIETTSGHCVTVDKKTSDGQSQPEEILTPTVNQRAPDENTKMTKIDDATTMSEKERSDLVVPEEVLLKNDDSQASVVGNGIDCQKELEIEVIQAREVAQQEVVCQQPKGEENPSESHEKTCEEMVEIRKMLREEVSVENGEEASQKLLEEQIFFEPQKEVILSTELHHEETAIEFQTEEVLSHVLSEIQEEKNEVNVEPKDLELVATTPPPSLMILKPHSQVDITITPPIEENSASSFSNCPPEADVLITSTDSQSQSEESSDVKSSNVQSPIKNETITQKNEEAVVIPSTVEMNKHSAMTSQSHSMVSAPAMDESTAADESASLRLDTDCNSLKGDGSPIPPPRRYSQATLNGIMPMKKDIPPKKNSSLPTKKTAAMAKDVDSKSSSLPSTPVYALKKSPGKPSIISIPREASVLYLIEEEEGDRKKKGGMFSWLGGDSSKKKNNQVLDSVSDGLRKIYKTKLYPLEEHYKFHDFHSPALDDPDFDAKPMILLVGQYSTGKTTFIRYLLEQDFPGIRIGPEPTTDRFIAVMHGDEEGVIPGNALVVDAKKQFRALSGFGNAFLNRFQCSTLKNQVLESITIVDTPGILSGEKQRIDRGYDFTGVLEWFAERVDRIILLFDAHKLDISDEFKRCIEALGGNEDKIRIVLNKSDMVDHQQLMRVYGALMWSLGKVFRTPEVSRVYLGSFWDKPLTYDINRRLFVDEQHDLFQDLQALPRNAALRKLNDLIKRARLAKVHAYIISELRKQMPSMIGKDKKKKELIQNLDKIFEQIQREHNISPGDFPDIQKMREKLQNQDFTKFNPLKPKLLEVVDGMLASDIARLMAQIPKEEQMAEAANNEQPSVRGGAFAQAAEAETPFGFGRGEGFDKGADESGWVVSRERSVADSTFNSLAPVNGFISGRAAKEHMVKSKLPNAVLGKIWKLADVDQDGQLDADEFALANYLINLKLEGHELPAELPAHLIPPSKRDKEPVYPNLEEE